MKIGICIFTAQEFLSINDYCGGEYRYLLKVAQCLSELGHEVVVILENNKDEVIKKANKKLNLPVLNEKQEAQLLEASFDMGLEMVKGIKE